MDRHVVPPDWLQALIYSFDKCTQCTVQKCREYSEVEGMTCMLSVASLLHAAWYHAPAEGLVMVTCYRRHYTCIYLCCQVSTCLVFTLVESEHKTNDTSPRYNSCDISFKKF